VLMWTCFFLIFFKLVFNDAVIIGTDDRMIECGAVGGVRLGVDGQLL
jgi:hypothetical protein